VSDPTPPGNQPQDPNQPNPYGRPQDTPGRPGQPGSQPGQPGQYGEPGPYGQPGGYGAPEPGYGPAPGQPWYGAPGQPGYGVAPAQPGDYGQPGPYGAAPAGMGQPYGFGYGPAAGADFASWGSRVGAYLIDGLIALIPLVAGYIVFFVTLDSDGQSTGTGTLFALLGWLGYLAVLVWNLGYKQGTTGQSIGKGVLGIKVVGTTTRMPIGFGMGLLRALMHAIFNNLCFLNVLWPLWDQQKQTWTDKVVNTYVVRT
jgi:uncharacterized RDD family membrane protein YckC